jgi:hypothetical protein
MAEPLPEPDTPTTLVEPPDAEHELARKNLVWGWALFGVFCVLFGGSVLIALVYLWLD